jgi:predicted lipid-binding transport protein (Tim44 family)
MPNLPLLEIFVFAAITGVVLFRLYSVLGRRTGQERPPQDAYRLGGVTATAQPLPADRPSDPVGRGLFDIKLADKSFETERFTAGARNAYERIVTAFAAGDRATLRPLLSDEVYGVFDTAIREREARKESIAFTFTGLKEAKIIQAGMRDKSAEITLTFAGQFTSATRNEKGDVIEGDTTTVREVTDVWSFARDIRARDPDWLLVATSGEMP